MRRITLAIFLFSICFLPALIYAIPEITPSWKSEYISFAEKQDYQKSIDVLSKAEESDPDNTEIKLAKARVYDWSGEHEKAENILSEYLEKYPDDVDAQFQLGALRFHQGQLQEAEGMLTKIVDKYPEYTEVQTTLKNVRRAITSGKEYLWQVDVGYEYSNFSRRKQPSWNQEFLQFTHFLNDKTTAIHGTFRRYYQFTNTDSEIEIGIDHRFSPRIYGHLTGDISPDTDFRPNWFVTGGGGFRLDDPKWHWPLVAWFTLDTRYDRYPTLNVYNINPGLRLEPFDNWAVAWRSISVHQQDTKTVYGWNLRLDGQIITGWRFYIGWADAPETVVGITVDTETYFSGLTIDLTPQHVLRLGYVHDNRENSYIREVYNASFSYRF